MALRVVLLLLLALLSPACVVDALSEEMSTEFTIRPAPTLAGSYEVRKRFTLSRDPNTADEVRLETIELEVIDPADADLSFLQQIRIYAVVDGMEVLIARGRDFEAGVVRSELEVEVGRDLKSLLSSDGRLYLTFRVVPSRWYAPFPPGGISMVAVARAEIVL